MKKIVIAGSFAALEEMRKLTEKLEAELNVKCILPRHFRGYKNQRKIEELKINFPLSAFRCWNKRIFYLLQ